MSDERFSFGTQAIVCMVSFLTYIWVAAAVWHMLPKPFGYWWGYPAMITTIFLGAASYTLPLYIFHVLGRTKP